MRGSRFITASKAIDFGEIAALAAELLGRHCTKETIGDDSHRAGLVSHGFPEVMADALGSLFKASRAREFAVVDPTLERVLGREPILMRSVLAGFLHATTGSLSMDCVLPR